MLHRFFKNRDRLNDPDPRIRREAVLTLDAGQARGRVDTLVELLLADPDRGVRLAVIERLETPEPLAQVLNDEIVGDAAARRIVHLARSRGAALPAHPRVRTLALLDAAPAEQQQLLAAETDPEQLTALALKDRGSLRSAVLQHPVMQTGAALALLEKRSRGSDKSLNRHAREALDMLKRLQQQAAGAASRAAELAESLSRTASGSDRTAYDRAMHLYRECTAALAIHATTRDALAGFGESIPDLESVRARLRPPEPPRAAPPEPTPPAVDTAELAAPPPVSAVSTDTDPPTATTPVTNTPEAAPPAVPTADPVAEIDPAHTAAAPAPDPAERAARQAAAAAQRAAAEAIESLLDAAETALEGGSSSTARPPLGEARQRLDALGNAAPRNSSRRLARLSARLAELRDWQTFATGPKREALCAALQVLVDQPLPPPDQAQRLKSLRADWRELGPVANASDARLADRFNALAEQAFEPCRAYFAEQAELRERNLAERARICTQLADYLQSTDWHRADMKAAEQILRTARDAWRGCQPVDRRAAREVDARFESLQEDLHHRIKAHWERNAAAKQALVDAALALCSDDGEIDSRINQAKGLQQQWKAIGPVQPRPRDQALWSAFRSACDNLFTARDAVRESGAAEARLLAAQCAAALDAFETTLGELTPTSASPAQARALREQMRDLDALPAQARQPLAQRRDELLKRHWRLLEAQSVSAQRARLEALEHADREFSAAEAAHADGAPAPAVPERCFEPRLARAGGPVPFDTLRRLTLRAEQAAGIAPPPEDESLRLEIQVERLRAGMSRSDADDPLQLAEHWCGMGPKDAGVDGLRKRFFTALQARLA